MPTLLATHRIPERELRAVLISPNSRLLGELQSLEELPDVRIVRVIEEYPHPDDLLRIVRVHAPQLVLFDTGVFETAVSLLRSVRAEVPNILAVAIHQSSDEALLRATLRAGFDDFLTRPLRFDSVRECFDHFRARIGVRPVAPNNTDLVFSFLPAKPGVGTTMLTVNTAAAIAGTGTRTLLTDLDLNCGLVRFMLKIQNPHSVVDAVRMVNELDENLWPQMITSIGTLDVLPAGSIDPQPRLVPVQLRRLIDFTRRSYRVVCADLSGNLEDFSIEVMRESKRIFIVTTPDVASLHLARAKHQLLASLDLADRTALLLNRAGKDALLTNSEIETVVGLPVEFEFPDDEKTAHEALSKAMLLRRNTALGTRIGAFANTLIDARPRSQRRIRKRFVDYFSLVPARYQLQR
jgi:Flp pilus assembly CpaE family ATPase